MLYFFIFPLFAVVVLLLSGLVIASRFITALRPVYPFAWRILLWSSLGFLVANGMVLGVPLLVAWMFPAMEKNEVGKAMGSGIVLVLLLGPIVASLAGFGGGTLLGVMLARAVTRDQSARLA